MGQITGIIAKKPGSPLMKYVEMRIEGKRFTKYSSVIQKEMKHFAKHREEHDLDAIAKSEDLMNEKARKALNSSFRLVSNSLIIMKGIISDLKFFHQENNELVKTFGKNAKSKIEQREKRLKKVLGEFRDEFHKEQTYTLELEREERGAAPAVLTARNLFFLHNRIIRNYTMRHEEKQIINVYKELEGSRAELDRKVKAVKKGKAKLSDVLKLEDKYIADAKKAGINELKLFKENALLVHLILKTMLRLEVADKEMIAKVEFPKITGYEKIKNINDLLGVEEAKLKEEEKDLLQLWKMAA